MQQLKEIERTMGLKNNNDMNDKNITRKKRMSVGCRGILVQRQVTFNLNLQK